MLYGSLLEFGPAARATEDALFTWGALLLDGLLLDGLLLAALLLDGLFLAALLLADVDGYGRACTTM